MHAIFFIFFLCPFPELLPFEKMGMKSSQQNIKIVEAVFCRGKHMVRGHSVLQTQFLVTLGLCLNA